MEQCPIARVVRVIDGVRGNLDEHSRTCGDQVTGLALNPSDHEELKLLEIWGLPVLSWRKLEKGRCELLCEAVGLLTPEIETFEDLQDHWTFALPRTPREPDTAQR